MTTRTGLILRTVGPLIEILCLSALFRLGGEDRPIGGFSLRGLLLMGMAAGLAMVVAGLALPRKTYRSRKPSDDEENGRGPKDTDIRLRL